MNLLATLRYLVALNTHQHFGRAAQACNVTQPALSNALRSLEEEFGTAIVKRGRNYAGLTPEGERVLSTAQRMLRERDLLQQELDSAAARPQGRLTLGAVPTAVPIVARFAAKLKARCPGISPIVRSMSSPEIEAGLESLSLDLGLGYTDRIKQQNTHLATIAQYTEHYFLVQRTDEPNAKGLHVGKPVSWREAGELPLCLLTPEMHNRTIVGSALAMAGVEVKPEIETNSVLTLALSVVAGNVCSILPGALVDAVRTYAELQARPLTSPDVRTPVGFMMVATDRPSRTLRAAVDLARDPEWLSVLPCE
ncbi:LysR family transcriptional regulator [Verminephrobacter aporrectodeae subsp. tuberculatae]|uniref:LysR family transcriptional regulator n=1 Tax=Verminephrobacter aporrectodeae subsp. tuberculatae TaxID=1110392 RepID=A0ABT3KVT9_9BURK|nr:LysR family transcriptional regulator [Verminephrobacter aporrectodeae]MCW5322469.1 LysR family transcriptional regulator [Verminephrobacter aporrectodeae subsp. tuberculatae]